MTDAEKELRRLAEEAERKRCGGYWPDDLRRLHSALWPKDVLALLDRIKALEKQVGRAERKGAEEMRKAIVIRLRETARGYDEVAEMMAGDVKATTDRLRLCARAWEDEDAAEDILTLRLPGDAP